MTIKGPKGRMTRALVTPYRVGDVVMLTTGLKDCTGVPRPGAIGVIRRIVIPHPVAECDDNAFLMFDVKFKRGVLRLADEEIAPATEANRWLRRQLDGLDAK